MKSKTKKPTKAVKSSGLSVTVGSTIRAIMRRHTKAVGSKNEYRVLLEVDHQSFFIDGLHTRKQANWYRRCLAIALHRLLSNVAGQTRPAEPLKP